MHKEELCVSLAWDWIFRGVTPAGIHREICNVLECSALNRRQPKLSLAIPELSLLHLARAIQPDPETNRAREDDDDNDCMIAFKEPCLDNGESRNPLSKQFQPSSADICRGILQSFRYIVEQHINVMENAMRSKTTSQKQRDRVSIADRPNAHEDPMRFPVDPYGNGDFFCKLCFKELSNVYFHCDGCEKLLSKDFNICQECHAEGKYKIRVQMHNLNDKRHSTLNHVGK